MADKSFELWHSLVPCYSCWSVLKSEHKWDDVEINLSDFSANSLFLVPHFVLFECTSCLFAVNINVALAIRSTD